jgi:hypothetical protein
MTMTSDHDPETVAATPDTRPEVAAAVVSAVGRCALDASEVHVEGDAA